MLPILLTAHLSAAAAAEPDTLSPVAPLVPLVVWDGHEGAVADLGAWQDQLAATLSRAGYPVAAPDEAEVLLHATVGVSGCRDNDRAVRCEIWVTWRFSPAIGLDPLLGSAVGKGAAEAVALDAAWMSACSALAADPGLDRRLDRPTFDEPLKTEEPKEDSLAWTLGSLGLAVAGGGILVGGLWAGERVESNGAFVITRGVAVAGSVGVGLGLFMLGVSDDPDEVDDEPDLFDDASLDASLVWRGDAIELRLRF